MHEIQIHLKVWFFTIPTCFGTSVPSSESSYTKLENLLLHNIFYPYELPEDDTDLPKHVGEIKDHTLSVSVTCAVSWFCE
jgi:hypothetical protein